MNILMINKADRVGGAAQIAGSLKSGLQQRGHEVNFFVCDRKSVGQNVFAIPRSQSRFYWSHLLGTDIDFFQSDYILSTKEFRAADIVHFHNLHGHYFNLQTFQKICQSKPVLWTLHDLWAITAYCSQAPGRELINGFYDCPISSSKSIMKYFNQAYLRWRKRRVYKNLKINLVAPSLWLKNKLVGSVLADQSITLIHHGIDTQIFKPQDKLAARQELNLPADKKIVLFVSSGGRDNLWKGWNYAAQVIEDYKDRQDVLFICLGGDSLPAAGNLRYIEYIPDYKILAKYYAAADIYLLTSLAESFALVVIEALACGLPVVSFPVGIVSEVIKHRQNGYIAAPGDCQELGIGLNYFFGQNEAALKSKMFASAENIAKEYTLERMIGEYESLYKNIC